MPKICYVPKDFHNSSLRIIYQAEEIIDAYQAQGYRLTLRQLFYQFVARDLISNTVKSYSRLGRIINDARLAGYIDWLAIEDRTRNLADLAHWNDPAEIVRTAANGYREDLWATQPVRIEVWIEKEALAGVFERVCKELDVPFLSCRGYTSQSEMWAAAQRLRKYHDRGQLPYIFHFGDHDPSGIDMTRDIRDRLDLFGVDVEVDRLALNMDQIDEFNPPPNPAKTTDSRFETYLMRFGGESWELDALEPQVLADLVREAVVGIRDEDAWEAAEQEQEQNREYLRLASDRWEEVTGYLED